MKKFCILLIIFLSCKYLNAQEIKLGVKAGVNLSTIAEGTDYLSNKTLFHAGIIANIKLSEKVALQPELIYSQQGTYFDSKNYPYIISIGNSPLEGFKTDTTLNYLNMPIYINYEVIDNLSINIGPQLGYLLDSKIESTGPGFIGTNEIISSVFRNPEFFEKFSFGFNAGLSYEVNDLVLSTNYNFGVSDINNTDDFNANRVFQVSVGYFFL